MSKPLGGGSWAFEELSLAGRKRLTHIYHPYPTRFVPQLASRLIEIFSQEGDLVFDPFCGSGTTLVESLVRGRRAVGSDSNCIAVLISKAKTFAFHPDDLRKRLTRFLARLTTPPARTRRKQYPPHPRLEYWFSKENMAALCELKWHIDRVRDARFRTFLRCSFSAILKRCSYWPSYSVRSLRRPDEPFEAAFAAFTRQCRAMERGNAEFYDALNDAGAAHLLAPTQVRLQDARTATDTHVDLVITSPPYCTSYNYAELHQLSAFWLARVRTVASWSKHFIGSPCRDMYHPDSLPEQASAVLAILAQREQRRAAAISRYWQDMREAYRRIHKSLRQGGTACIVLGDTRHCGLDIPNVAVTKVLLSEIGLELEAEIRRAVPNKSLPHTRDPKTGRFTSAGASRISYANEFILVARKRPSSS